MGFKETKLKQFREDLKTASIPQLEDMAFHYTNLEVDEEILTEIAKELRSKRKARRERMK